MVGIDPVGGVLKARADEIHQEAPAVAQHGPHPGEVRCHGRATVIVGLEVLVLARNDEATLARLDVLQGGQKALRRNDEGVVVADIEVEGVVADVAP